MAKEPTPATKVRENLRAAKDCVSKALDGLPREFDAGVAVDYVLWQMQQAQRLLRDCVQLTVVQQQRKEKGLPEALPVSTEEETRDYTEVRPHKRRLKKENGGTETVEAPTEEPANGGGSAGELS